MLAQVKHHFDDELRKKTADYQEELDDFENTCKCLMLKERRANDQVNWLQPRCHLSRL